MPQHQEYTAPTVGESGCTYSSLKHTYGGRSALQETRNMAQYIVPKLCPGASDGLSYPPKYSTFSHDAPLHCGGHFSMKWAYPAADCTTCALDFVKRPCNGTIHKQCDSVEHYKHSKKKQRRRRRL